MVLATLVNLYQDELDVQTGRTSSQEEVKEEAPEGCIPLLLWGVKDEFKALREGLQYACSPSNRCCADIKCPSDQKRGLISISLMQSCEIASSRNLATLLIFMSAMSLVLPSGKAHKANGYGASNA